MNAGPSTLIDPQKTTIILVLHLWIQFCHRGRLVRRFLRLAIGVLAGHVGRVPNQIV